MGTVRSQISSQKYVFNKTIILLFVFVDNFSWGLARRELTAQGAAYQ